MSEFQQFFISNTPSFPQANCAEMPNPDIFFPETREELKQVLPMLRKTCGSCIHQADCLKYALDESIEHGIWGGLTPAERKRIKPLKKRPYTSEVGEKVDQLRKQGIRFNEIAERLGTTVAACQQAHRRHRIKRGIA